MNVIGSNYYSMLLICVAISQTLKYGIRLWITRHFSVKDLGKTYLYNSGFPSSHSAVIAASTLFFISQYGWTHPTVQSHGVFAYFWLFEIYMQRKRHTSSTELFLDELIRHDEHLKVLKDLHGHDFIDIVGGILLGAGVFWLVMTY